MGEVVTLTAADGHSLDGYRAIPGGEVRSGLVIIQEIFGVTDHIKRVVDGYAADGFAAIAPAFFDRVERGVAISYTDMQTGRDLVSKLKPQDTLMDLEAARSAVDGYGKTAACGFCWGGVIAYMAACKLDVACAVAYYGVISRVMDDMQPRVPVMYHFGGADPHIPMDTVAQIKTAVPDGIYHVYDNAGHGFNCDDRSDFDADASQLARQRSLAFLAEHM